MKGKTFTQEMIQIDNSYSFDVTEPIFNYRYSKGHIEGETKWV